MHICYNSCNLSIYFFREWRIFIICSKTCFNMAYRNLIVKCS